MRCWNDRRYLRAERKDGRHNGWRRGLGQVHIRVNAIAPGFFLTEQNRFLLTDERTGELTARGARIIAHTPMGRFGRPEDLAGALVWLVSDASAFVTGIVLPIDGGFSAFSGV